MAVRDAHVFPGFLTPVLIQFFFLMLTTTFPTCFCRGERRKYAGKKVCLNQWLNLQPPGHESDMLITEPPKGGNYYMGFRLLGRGSEVSCPRTFPWKTPGIKCVSNLGPLGYESHTLPLSHAGPLAKMIISLYDWRENNYFRKRRKCW